MDEMKMNDLLICAPVVPGYCWQVRSRGKAGNSEFWRYANNPEEARKLAKERADLIGARVFVELSNGKRVPL